MDDRLNELRLAAIAVYSRHYDNSEAENAAYYLGYSHAIEDIIAVRHGDISWEYLIGCMKRRLGRI